MAAEEVVESIITMSSDDEYNSVINELNKFDRNHQMYKELCKHLKIIMSMYNAQIHINIANDLIRNMNTQFIENIGTNSNHYIFIASNNSIPMDNLVGQGNPATVKRQRQV